MASIRKRVSNGKPRFFVEVRVKGKSRRKTFDTKHQAQQWALSTEQEMGKHGGVVTGRTLGEAMTRYTKEISPQKKGARWEIIRLKKIGRDDIASILLHNLTTDDLQAWVKESLKRIGPSSVNRDFTLLGSVLKAARVEWKWMAHEPAKDVRKPKDPPPRDRRISDDEIKLILKALDGDEMRRQIGIAFQLAIETAMRQGEIWGLEWERVNLERRFISLLDTKNGTRREVPLSKQAIALLKQLHPQKSGKVFTACTQQTLDVIFRRAVKLAGIRDLHWHDSRHEAITRMARKLDVLDLARAVGHKDLRSLQIYYNPTASQIAERLD